MDVGVRKGSWTDEEDTLLFNYVHLHGEGRWNSVPLSAGLKRTGKSCRLRWLNYLNPRVRRGNITLQEQLLILQLHFRWGNRWSKIAQFLPGRTDNEIKNYWRTRVQKQAKHLNCDINSKQFRDSMRFVWIPRLIERIQSSSEFPISFSDCSQRLSPPTTFSNCSETAIADRQTPPPEQIENSFVFPASYVPSPDSADQVIPISAASPTSEMEWSFVEDDLETSLFNGEFGKCSDPMDGLWNEDDLWFLQQQLYDYSNEGR